jgi:hypothetical protein
MSVPDAVTEPVYGIDFGMSNSSLIIGMPDGTVSRVHDPLRPHDRSSCQVPTVVCPREDGSLAVGTEVERTTKVERPQFYRSEFKRDFGKGPKDLGARWYEVHELAAEVLRFLRDRALEIDGRTPRTVLCTVPAIWERGNRTLLRRAAGLAGFDASTVELATEPEAAAAYALDNLELPPMDRKLLVYDLGGGTFDCAVVAVNPTDSQVLGTDGLADLGGVAFNGMIRDLAQERYQAIADVLAMPEPTGGSVDQATEYWNRRIRLYDSFERIKIHLSRKSPAEERLTWMRPQVTFELARADFEERLRPKLGQTLAACERLLTRCGLVWEDIDYVVPVGGGSHIPLVGSMLAALGPATVLRVSEPDLAVVLGATLLARQRVRRPGGMQRRKQGLERVTTAELTTPRPINTIAFHPAGDRLAVGCRDATVREWNLRTDDVSLMWHGHWVADVAYSERDGNRLATIGRDSIVRIWDMMQVHNDRSQPIITVPPLSAGAFAHHVAFSPDGRRLLTHRGELAEVRDADSCALERSFWASDTGGVSFGPGNCLVLSRRGLVRTVDAETGREGSGFTGGADFVDVRDVAISDDGKLVAAACARSGFVCAWELANGSLVLRGRHCQVHVIELIKVAFSPDARWLASAGLDSLSLWDLRAGSPPDRFVIGEPVRAVAFSPDGLYLAAAAGAGCHLFQLPDS